MSDETAITDEYLDRREELWSATTGGKWYRDKGTIHTDRGGDPVGRTGFVVWQGVRGYEPQEVLNNAEWILDAHEAMPLLVAEVRRLRAQLAEAGKDGLAAGILIGEVAKDLRTGADLLEE